MNLERYDFNTFKRNVNLSAFAASYGYEVDKKKTTKTSIAMKSGNDKVIISKKKGIWVYFSVNDDADSGTIVDFVKNRTNKTMPEIGRMLAAQNGLSDPLPTSHKVENQSYDIRRVKAIFNRCDPFQRSRYLESRGLDAELIKSTRFTGRVFVDRHCNVVFPHFENGRLSGLELKNRDRGLLVKGSKKTFWRSNSSRSDSIVVVTEAVIDALSYAKLFQNPNELYLATGGGVSASQCQLFAKMLSATNTIKKVVIATDSDSGGDRIAKRLLKTARKSSYTGRVTRHRPPVEGDDWNDELLRRELVAS